jgi:putative oxygen-independent coproporphyrinogen III oxidase
MQELPPLSLYVHFPWCVAKCPYCDFNSHTLRGELAADTYIDALLQDLASLSAEVTARPLATIFLGGGTPSLFPPAEMLRLLEAVAASFELAPDIEITLEANPGAVEHGSFAGYRSAGINRLSLGVQSFNDECLRALGRIHDAAAARRAFTEARAAGFDNINIDLMYALPGQSVAAAQADVAAALELQPQHVSFYQLTLEPNTVFFSRPPALPDQEQAWQIQRDCSAQLMAGGFDNYEISAWAQPGRRCRHNLNYWRFGYYVGLGAGAHGKLTDVDGSVTRSVRAANPRAFMRDAGGLATTSAQVGTDDRRFEFMLNALRLRDGFTLADFEQSTGLPADCLEEGLQEARQKQLIIEQPDGWLRPSELGWRFLDDLQAIFLPDREPGSAAANAATHASNPAN